jgi:hypothetical protein
MKKQTTAIIVGSLIVGLMLSLTVANAASPQSAKARPLAGPPATAQFSSFGVPRTSADVLPTQLGHLVAVMNANPANVPDDLYEGQEIATQSRLLANNLGRGNASVYVYPTTKGRVCFVGSVGPTGGCVTAAEPVGWIQSRVATASGNDLVVYGIAPNDVVSVNVIVGGASVTATLAHNLFFFEEPVSKSAPTSIVVTRRNGTSQRFDLPGPAALLSPTN